MVRVEPGVNRSIEDYAAPSSGVCRPQCRANWRAPVGTNRLVTQCNKRCAGAEFTHPCVHFCFYRAKLTMQVATGFVRRSLFSLNLVCRTRLDRDFRTWGGYA